MADLALKKQNTLSHPISFIDLKAQQQRIRTLIDQAIQRVLDHGIYIMGPEIDAFENDLKAFCGAKYAISCSNGTDALALGLMAYHVKPGDAVFVPTFTFAATAEVVAWLGAIPIFIDVLPDTINMDPHSLEQGIKLAQKLSLKPTGVIPVDLFGLPADYDTIQAIANQHKLWVMADAAQSFGATYKGRVAGSIGDIATTSFFPAKPLGCYGDGGAIFTNDDNLANFIKSMRVHGQGSDKYDNIHIGMNGRLDTLQAAILIEKLKIFPEEIKQRQRVAQGYNSLLKDYVKTPYIPENHESVWAQYTIQLPQNVNRDFVMAKMKERGIPTVVYYPKPLHQQTAYKKYPCATNHTLPVSEELAQTVLSLPMSAYVSDDDVTFISETLIDILK